jgi:hypothetical protein
MCYTLREPLLVLPINIRLSCDDIQEINTLAYSSKALVTKKKSFCNICFRLRDVEEAAAQPATGNFIFLGFIKFGRAVWGVKVPL